MLLGEMLIDASNKTAFSYCIFVVFGKLRSHSFNSLNILLVNIFYSLKISCVCVCVCWCYGGQKSMFVGYIAQLLFILFLRQDVLLNLEFTDSAKLAGQHAQARGAPVFATPALRYTSIKHVASRWETCSL